MMAEPIANTNETEIARLWRKDVRRNDSCEVRDARHGSRQKARILSPSRSGCTVRYEDGHEAFAHWTNLFPPVDPPVERIAQPKFMATLQEVMPPQLSTPPKPQPVPTKAQQRRTLPHQTSAIGNIFRAERLKRALDQDAMAVLCHTNYNKISAIELGDSSPDDETLIHFAEEFAIPLDLLEAARDGKRSYAADPVLALRHIADLESKLRQTTQELERRPLQEGTSAALREQIKAVSQERDTLRRERDEARSGNDRLEREVTELQARPTSSALDFDAFLEVLEFTSHFAQLRPIPTDPDRRRAWYRVAFAAHEQMGKL